MVLPDFNYWNQCRLFPGTGGGSSIVKVPGDVPPARVCFFKPSSLAKGIPSANFSSFSLAKGILFANFRPFSLGKGISMTLKLDDLVFFSAMIVTVE